MDLSKLDSLLKKKKQDLAKKERTLKLQPGPQRFVLLPGWRSADPEIFWHAFGQHYVKNAADEVQAVHLCTDRTFGQPCQVCDALAKAMKSTGDKDTLDVLAQAAAQQKYLINVLALDSTEPNTPQILEVPKTVFSGIVNFVEEWAKSAFDPNAAQIFSIEKTGKGLSTRYTVQATPKQHKVPAAALSAIPDLDEYVRQESEEQMNRAIGAINSAAGLLPSRDVPTTRTSSLALAGKPGVEDARVSTKPAATAPSLDDEIDALLDGDLDEAA